MKNPLILIILLAAVGIVFYRKAQQNSAPATSDSPGTAAVAPQRPAFILPPGYAAGIPRLVSLGSVSCIPCKKMEPVREALRTEYAGQLLIDFIDVWENPAAGRDYRIRLIPTLILYDANGRELGRREGYISKEDLLPVLVEWGVVLTPAANV